MTMPARVVPTRIWLETASVVVPEVKKSALTRLLELLRTWIGERAQLAVGHRRKSSSAARVLRRSMALCVLGLLPAVLAAQHTSKKAKPTKVTADASTPAPSQQTPTPTEILPVFAIDMNFDPSWVDSADVPGKSQQHSHSGVNDSFQKAWDALQPAGFRTIRVKLDLRDAHSAARLASLCVWAKANNVTLIPVLENFSTADDLAAFPAAFVSRLRSGDGQPFAAYAQVLYFQVGSSIDAGAAHPEIKTGEAQKILLSAAGALRNAELQALDGSGVAPSPIMVSASFDYELIQQGAIAGVALDPAAEQKAQASLKRFLEPLAADTNIDVINVEWFPRSISSGDADRFAILLRELESSLPGKHVLLTTGFSSAFNTADQQTQFLTLATTNLWNFRLGDGDAGSQFLGVIVEQALKDMKSDAAAPAGSGDPSKWKWKDKVAQLARMQSGGKPSAELKWWLAKVRGNMALLAPQPDASGGTDFVSLPALQTFQQISAAVAQARQNINSPAAKNSMSTGTADPQAGQAVTSRMSSASVGAPDYSGTTPAAPATQIAGSPSPSPYQQLMMTLVQQATTQLTTALVTKVTGSSGNKAQQFPPYAPTDPATVSQPGFATAGSQAQDPAFYGQNDGGSLPAQMPSAATASSTSTSSNPSGVAGSLQTQVSANGGQNVAAPVPSQTPFGAQAPRVKSASATQAPSLVRPQPPVATPASPLGANAPANPPAGMTTPKTDAATSGIPTSRTQAGHQVSSNGAASSQPAPAPAVRSVRPTDAATAAGSTPTQPTSPQAPRTVQPVANNQPSQNATAVQRSAAPLSTPTVRSVQSPPSQVSRATPTTAQPSVAVASQPVRPGPGQTSSPSAQAVAPAPPAVPATAQLVRPGPRSGIASPTQTSVPAQTAASAPANHAATPSAGRLDLSIAPADIRLTPTGAGQLAVTAMIRNAGTIGTGAANVVFRVNVANKQVAVSQPINFSIAGGAVFQASWTTPVPPGQSLQVSVLVSASGDANPANNQAVLAITTPPAVASRR